MESKYEDRFAKAKAPSLDAKEATQRTLALVADFLEAKGEAFLPERCPRKDRAVWTEGQRLAVNYIRLGARQ